MLVEDLKEESTPSFNYIIQIIKCFKYLPWYSTEVLDKITLITSIKEASGHKPHWWLRMVY